MFVVPEVAPGLHPPGSASLGEVQNVVARSTADVNGLGLTCDRVRDPGTIDITLRWV